MNYENNSYTVPTGSEYWNPGDFDDSTLPEDIYEQAAEIEGIALEKEFPGLNVKIDIHTNQSECDSELYQEIQNFCNDNYTLWLQEACDNNME